MELTPPPEPPEPEVLAHFGATVMEDLGGRETRNWIVSGHTEPAVLRRYPEHSADIAFEHAVLRHMAERGWPVPDALSEPVVIAGRTWALTRLLQGAREHAHGDEAHQRARGRLLAELHADLEQVGLGQRDGWHMPEKTVIDPALYEQLGLYERFFPEDARMLRWHAERARELLALIDSTGARLVTLHGDLTAWNLLHRGTQLTGVLDFEFTHLNFLVADFALSWRGKYDGVVRGYDEVRKLDDIDWALITPVYWAWVLFGVASLISEMLSGEAEPVRMDWILKRLTLRSPLMGKEASPYAP